MQILQFMCTLYIDFAKDFSYVCTSKL